MRLIDADVLEREGWSLCRTFQKDKDTMVYEVKKPSDFPSIDAVPVVHGRWIDLSPQGDNRFMCTVCKWKENVPTCMGEPKIWDFCPSCGARMDGKDGDNG